MTTTAAEQVGQAALSGFAQYENQIAELKRQLEDMQGGCASYILMKEATQKMTQRLLLESQAREVRLRETLKLLPETLIAEQPEWDMSENNGVIWGLYLSRVCGEALTLPHDDTALKEYRNMVIEECALELCNFEAGALAYLIRKLKKE